MELFIFGRFHAREGQEDAVAAAMREVLGPTREEPGCLAIGHYRSIRDPRLFYVHSRWVDEAAFEVHAAMQRDAAADLAELVGVVGERSLVLARDRVEELAPRTIGGAARGRRSTARDDVRLAQDVVRIRARQSRSAPHSAP